MLYDLLNVKFSIKLMGNDNVGIQRIRILFYY